MATASANLTQYEAEQVRQISLWKSERPSLLLESYRTLTRPLSKLATRIVSGGLLAKALEKVESVAEADEAAADLLKAAGASTVADLQALTLEECDRLAQTISARAEHLALLEGAVPAAAEVALPMGAGEVATVLDVPVLLEASIRAVRRVGHCYGFPLKSRADRLFILAILDIAGSDNQPGREEAHERLWVPVAREADAADAAKSVEEGVVDDLPLELVPIVGEVANLLLDYAFVRRVDRTARRVFQERWLRANDKVESIPPSPISRRRSSVEGIVAVGSEVAYVGAYGVSFGVTFPATLAALAVTSVAPDPVLRGFRDGATAAGADSREFLGRLSRAAEPRTGGALVPATAG